MKVWTPVPESVHIFAMEPEPFRAITLGLKQAVVLPLSLGALVGDQVVFREWREQGDAYTGSWLCRRVTHEERGVRSCTSLMSFPEGIDPLFAVYSLNNASENEGARAYLEDRLARARREGLSQEQFWCAEHERQRSLRELLRAV